MNEIPDNTVVPEVKYSTVKCSVCGKFLYYGKMKEVIKYVNPQFTCKCRSPKMVNGECSICHSPVKYDIKHEKEQWLRCCCGHAEIIPKDKINEVTML